MEANTNYNENNAYFRAKKRVEELKGFYGNLISYCYSVLILSTSNFHHNFIGFGFRLLAGIWSSDACFTSF
jgi:hypothetical protein